MASFTEALGAFLSDVGSSLQEFVDTVNTKDEAATTQAATVQRPTAQRTAPAPAPARSSARNMTRVRLDLDVAHDGSALDLHREFQDYARTHGRSENAATLVQFLQSRQGVTPRSWSTPDYAGYGSRS